MRPGQSAYNKRPAKRFLSAGEASACSRLVQLALGLRRRWQGGDTDAVGGEVADLGGRRLAVDAAVLGRAFVDGSGLAGERISDVVEVVLDVAADLAEGLHHHF